LSHFAALGIPLRPESLDVLLTKAEKENLSHLDFLDQLIGEQADARRERSATGDFIRRRTNLILVGWSGVGKSHIIQALGQKACVLGYRVLYRTSAQLISDLTASLADKTLPEKLRRYARPDLLIIDEFGCDRIEREESPQSAHLLYKIIALRNQKSSTALATNVDFEKWGEYLPDGPVAMAFLDRIVEGAIILKIQGRSYRAHGSKQGERPA
jgi:DNA replication protein DnaC